MQNQKMPWKEKLNSKKERIFGIIQIGHKEDLASRIFDYVITVAIFLNVTVLVLETFEQFDPYIGILRGIELVTIAMFCVEYACRIWTADLLYPDLTKRKARLRFLRSYDGVVDLLTILPFFFLGGFVAFRILRVARIFHLFRINASYDSFNVITTVLYEKRNQILSSLCIILVLMLASSMCIYGVEHKAQPDVFKNAFSGIWWSMSTIFTVGYGDIYPITVLGRFFALVTTLLGVGAVAIPTGIISAGFVEQYTNLQAGGNRKSAHLSHMVTITANVDSASEFLGRTIEAIEDNSGIIVSAILREGAILVPADELRVELGDVIVYQKDVGETMKASS